MNDVKLYGDYRVRVFDKDGELVQSDIVEDTGSVTIEDVFENAVIHGVDEIEIVPIKVEARDEEETITRIETTDDIEPKSTNE